MPIHYGVPRRVATGQFDLRQLDRYLWMWWSGVGVCVILAKAKSAVQIIAVDVNEAAQRLYCWEPLIRSACDRHGPIIRAVKETLIDGHGDVTVDAAGFASTCENAVHCARPSWSYGKTSGLPIIGSRDRKVIGTVAKQEVKTSRESQVCSLDDLRS
jgi:Zn-dependent alcohol dehydrogenase